MPLIADDVMMKIHLVINDHLIGFDATYNDCRGESAKKKFLNLSLALVCNGWTKKFEQQLKNSCLTEAKSFFSDHIKYFFINSPETLFPNRTDISQNDQSVIAMFAQLSLLKGLFKCYENDPKLLDVPQLYFLMRARLRLNQNYRLLPAIQAEEVEFKGKVINSIEEFDLLIMKEKEAVAKSKKRQQFFSFLVFSTILPMKFKKSLPKKIMDGLWFLRAISLVFLSYDCARQLLGQFRLFDQPAQRSQITLNYLSTKRPLENNPQIKKFLIISDEEMNHLLTLFKNPTSFKNPGQRGNLNRRKL